MRFLLGHDVVSVSGSTETFVRRRMGADGPEDVTVDDAAWATLRTSGGAVASLEVTRMATGRKNSLTIEVYGSDGALAFDLERLNELSVCTDPGAGFTRMLVTEADQPYVGAWWPPGHVLGWDHTFTSQAADFLTAIGERRRAVAVVRRRAGRAAGAGGDRGEWGTVGASRLTDRAGGLLMGAPYTLFTGQWADLTLAEVAELAAGWGYDGLEIAVSGEHLDAWRWDDDDYIAERRAILDKHGLGLWAISNHLTGQAVCDDPIDFRHQAIVRPRVWGDGDPEGVRQRAAEEMQHTARLAQRARREDRRRLHGVVDLAVRRDVPARGRRPDRGGVPGLRRPLEPDPRRLRRVRRAVRARGASLRDRLRLLVDACARWTRSATARRSG